MLDLYWLVCHGYPTATGEAERRAVLFARWYLGEPYSIARALMEGLAEMGEHADQDK